WYFWNSAFFLDKASGLINEVTVSGGDPRTLAGWLFYLKEWPSQMGVPNALFTAIGIVLCLASYVRRPSLSDVGRRTSHGLLWMWFLSGYLILSSMANKDLRH